MLLVGTCILYLCGLGGTVDNICTTSCVYFVCYGRTRTAKAQGTYSSGCAEDIDIIPRNDTNFYKKDVWMVHEWVRRVVWVEKKYFSIVVITHY